MQDEITYAEVSFNRHGTPVVNTQLEKTNKQGSQKFKDVNKKTLTSRVMPFFMVFVIIVLLTVVITVAVLHLQPIKQYGPANHELQSLNFSVYSKFKEAEEKITILAFNQTDLQMKVHETEDNITELQRSKEALLFQLEKKINITIQHQMDKQENRTEEKYKEIENKLNMLNKIAASSNQGREVECCPASWKIFKQSCYYFSASRESWTNSRSTCKDWSSDLVVIKSTEEQDFLYKRAKELNKQPRYERELWYWIGLTDNEKEDTWKWVDGTFCECNYNRKQYWVSGEPDNWYNEDCALMTSEGGWSDSRCSSVLRFICEAPTSVCSL